MTTEDKRYKLLGADGKVYMSSERGAFGGYSRGKIYGQLDCPAALRAIAKGGYVQYRVFFKDEETAIAAGYRPCGTCLPEKYSAWKKAQEQEKIKAAGFGMKVELRVRRKCMFFWLMGIRKTRIDKCCAKCFIGETYGAIYEKTKHRDTAFVSMDVSPDSRIKAYYLCGISEGSRYENNTHIAFVPEKGSSFSIENDRIGLKVMNAREIRFQAYRPNPAGQYTDEQRTCRNWIFANYLKDGMPL